MNNRKEIMSKEIDLIQACINRMAKNSFVVKGWTITLVTVILTLFPQRVDIWLLCVVGIVATICFWYLDAFFLRTERLYRWKYEWVIANRLNSDEYCYDLNPNNDKMRSADKEGKPKRMQRILRVMFTKTLTPIYLPLLGLSIAILIVSIVAGFPAASVT